MKKLDELFKLASRATTGPWRLGSPAGQCQVDHTHGQGGCDYRIVNFQDWNPAAKLQIAQDQPIGSAAGNCIAIATDQGIRSASDAAYLVQLHPAVMQAFIKVAQAAEENTCCQNFTLLYLDNTVPSMVDCHECESCKLREELAKLQTALGEDQ